VQAGRFIEERYIQSNRAAVFGVVLSLCFNVGLLFVCRFNGLQYIYPPPEEKMLVDMEPMKAPEITVKRYGREPAAEEVVPDKMPEFVQKSESPLPGETQNVTREATAGNTGDVAVPEPPREQIDERSLFPSAQNSDKDTIAAHTASQPSGELKAGHASGNISAGKLDGAPTARVKGRTTVGVPQRPVYDVQNEGTVVVTIYVNPQGSVERAIPGGDGTTVTDKTLWNSARQAAMNTKFNVDPQAPGLMEGTITYVFVLK